MYKCSIAKANTHNYNTYLNGIGHNYNIYIYIYVDIGMGVYKHVCFC